MALPLDTLAHKLAMLLALANSNHCLELASLDLKFCSFQANEVKFVIPGLTKRSRKGPFNDHNHESVPTETGNVNSIIRRLYCNLLNIVNRASILFSYIVCSCAGIQRRHSLGNMSI